MSTPLIPAREDDTNMGLSDGPGRRLRIARQTHGLTQERAAGELHLSPALIEALEHDDYAALPDDVFVIGYIRKYAHLVELEPESLVAAYRAATSRTAPARTSTTPRTGFRTDSSHRVMGLAGLGVLILLGTLAFLWYQSRQPDLETETSAAGVARTKASTPTPETVPESRTPATPADTDPIAVRKAKLPSQPESDIQPPQHAGPATPTASEPQPNAATTAEKAEEGADGENTDEDATAATDTRPPTTDSGAEETEEAEKTEEPIAAKAGEIEIIFDGPCWVEVREREGNYKLIGAMKKGDRHVLGGKPPYAVKLGNSTVVRITVGGEPFDLNTASRGSVVARFTLDPDQLP